ncbi:segregation and condensation protein A [Rathayibacter toxicus]|uniref:Segregation and condensation protein A n=1 Tax=Rathayibacter toxicus TaxID=145458 RepID=A0A0C5BGV1_9MICO|nr:ScpA family protein [Rathayibacter toxicus]AJM77435.1 chromosome segregation protein ScpA [Rathayibacter toxicus]ALS56665.1 chromosome segregation protein ScpA [Rathayibacter toxicus]KKM44756.1 chromosome segregation protein ScpA [Rathayibacter toxicus]PPG21502.1 segregation/condensation protein A [Rathayibacter toxicus]PPG46466.1 segregation/condensation protein A [Rathayibacter toxicus]
MARSPEAVLTTQAPGFRVALSNFEGPFDLLLNLIAQHELDITEIALSAVTDEFLSYLHGVDTAQGLDRASEFLVVAATLLDLKIAKLLPQGELVDAEDAALLEARDLLFARLLQYRAFKQVSSWFAERMEAETTRHVRQVSLEERFREAKPDLVWTLSAEDFAALAAVACAPRELPTVGLDHLHAPLISIREQAAYVVGVLRERGAVTFREVTAEAAEKGVIVARFLAVLELYRHAALTFEQSEPLGEVTLQWVAEEWSDAMLAHLGADYDE